MSAKEERKAQGVSHISLEMEWQEWQKAYGRIVQERGTLNVDYRFAACTRERVITMVSKYEREDGR